MRAFRDPSPVPSESNPTGDDGDESDGALDRHVNRLGAKARCRVVRPSLMHSLPGDGTPKPIAFPDPATTAIRGAGFALLPMPRFVELTLASGMTAAHGEDPY